MSHTARVKVKNSEAEIEGEAAWETLAAHRDAILEELRQDFQAPGFRKGKAPMEVFLQHVRQDQVLEDAAERTLQEVYPLLIEENALETLGQPEVTVTKLAAGNPLGFRVVVGVVPQVKLPDYKKIAAKVVEAEPAVAVQPEEIEKVISELLQIRGLQEGSAGAGTAEKETEGAAKPAPELTDEFVKTLGNFENVADFRTKLAENMKLEKQHERQQERREKIAAALAEKTKMELPDRVLDAEADLMNDRLHEDLERAKITFEDYLAKLKKTAEELRAEHRTYAARQLETRFILDAIAKAENLTADDVQVDAEVRHLKQQHPEADVETLERYAATLLRNEKVLKFLEGATE